MKPGFPEPKPFSSTVQDSILAEGLEVLSDGCFCLASSQLALEHQKIKYKKTLAVAHTLYSSIPVLSCQSGILGFVMRDIHL